VSPPLPLPVPNLVRICALAVPPFSTPPLLFERLRVPGLVGLLVAGALVGPNGSMLMILVTCIVGPWTVEKYGRRVALGEERKPYEPAEAPQRILIPMSNPATAEALLDLAFLMRESGSREPLYPLTVVPGAGETVEAQVANAEKLLGQAVIYAAGAEVPVVPLTRVDFNFASGIARGIAETRSSLVIIGWDARRSAQRWIFGSVLDQLLEQTRQLVLVTRLGHPLNTTKQLVLVIPPGAGRAPGFEGALRVIKTLAVRLGAPIAALAVNSDPAVYVERLGGTPPVPFEVDAVRGWEALMQEFERRLGPDDLTVVVSARRGSPAWHRELRRLPGQLARLRSSSFVIVHPSEPEPTLRGQPPLPARLERLDLRHVVVDLPRMPLRDALRRLLHSAFGDNMKRLEELTEVLVRQEHGYPAEILPGVVLPHARVADLSRSLLFLGTSRAGVEHPAGRPAHLIFLLLSPADQPQEHLRGMAEIATFVSNPERLDELLRCRSAEQLFQLLQAHHD
jgi:mannitol/fructose-specific phosphotransferase system IIA component (Ntr-type)/nucleotide-binding universal stress UspA family protein